MKLQCPIPKILLPIDGSEHSKRALQFAGCLGASFGKGLSGITLLHVMAGSYLSRHLANIDFRAEILKQSEVFKRIKEDHIEKNIKPLLDEGEKILKDSGIEVKIEKLILDGDAAHEIVRIAQEGKFSTIIMARSGVSETRVLGSVANKVIHTASRQTIYIVGQKIFEDKKCPIPKILIPVDGSQYSMKGVEHVACLSGEFKSSLSRITLLRVINLAFFEERIREGIEPEDEAQRILNEAKTVFLEAGVSEGLITTKSKIGKPADEILKEAEEGNYNLIVMGRRGRSALKDLLLGGVSTTILNRCQQPTIAIVSSE